MIRGLALRCFTSLRLRSILEYIVVPLKAALTDGSGYVRAAGVMGVLKVWHLSPETIKDSDLVDTLYAMLRDREPLVVVNCLSTINEILAEEGGVAVNQALIVYLLNRVREFTDWGQCAVLALTAKYTPADEDEMFAIMNLLDGCLKVAHSGVVLGTVSAFLHLTRGNADLQRQVFLRLKTPLLTLMASSSNEVSFSVLGHVALVVERAPGVFADEYKQFFCKFTEPTAVKSYKMGILPRVASVGNSREIVAELTEYVSGVDAELARQAVRAIGEIALRVPEAAEGVVEALLELVEMDAEYVRGETIQVMQDLLRKYPERAATVVPSLHRCLRRLEGEEGGRAAVVWILGEYGQLIDDAPYLLEPLIDGLGDEPSVQVRCELLTAALKLFFKRPPEVKGMLERLFRACLADGVDALLHDRALLYYRLLRANDKEAAVVIAGAPILVSEFDEEVSPEVRAARLPPPLNPRSAPSPQRAPPLPPPHTRTARAGPRHNFQGVQHPLRALQEALRVLHLQGPLGGRVAAARPARGARGRPGRRPAALCGGRGRPRRIRRRGRRRRRRRARARARRAPDAARARRRLAGRGLAWPQLWLRRAAAAAAARRPFARARARLGGLPGALGGAARRGHARAAGDAAALFRGGGGGLGAGGAPAHNRQRGHGARTKVVPLWPRHGRRVPPDGGDLGEGYGAHLHHREERPGRRHRRGGGRRARRLCKPPRAMKHRKKKKHNKLIITPPPPRPLPPLPSRAP